MVYHRGLVRRTGCCVIALPARSLRETDADGVAVLEACKAQANPRKAFLVRFS